MTHRSRYAVATNRKTVIDLLVLDAQNPRSILYHLAEMREQATHLSEAVGKGSASAFSTAIARIHSEIAVLAPETLDTASLQKLGKQIETLSDVLSAEYLT